MTHDQVHYIESAPGFPMCTGHLIWIESGVGRTLNGLAPMHRDIYQCRNCHTRIALSDGKLLYVDLFGSLEAEGRPQTPF